MKGFNPKSQAKHGKSEKNFSQYLVFCGSYVNILHVCQTMKVRKHWCIRVTCHACFTMHVSHGGVRGLKLTPNNAFVTGFSSTLLRVRLPCILNSMIWITFDLQINFSLGCDSFSIFYPTDVTPLTIILTILTIL